MLLVFVAALCVGAHGLRLQAKTADIDEASFEWDELTPWEEEERRQFEYATKHFKPSKELKDAWGRQWEELHETDKGLGRTHRPHGKSSAVDACTQALVKSDFDYDALNATDAGMAHCADPWFKEKDCSKPFMVPLYRLGDCVMYSNPGRQDTTGLNRLAHKFPDSIARKYLERIQKYGKKDVGMDKLLPLYHVINGKEYDNYERPGPNDVAVHVRTGDVSWVGFDNGADPKHNHWETPCTKFGNGNSHACRMGMGKSKPEWQEDIKKVNWTNVDRVVLVSGDHKHPTVTLEQSVKSSRSKAVLDRVAQLIRDETGVQNVQIRFNYNPDCDFIFLSNAAPERYMKSGGNYDKMIYQMVLNKAAGIDPKA